MEGRIIRRKPRSEQTKRLLSLKLKAFYQLHPEARTAISDANKKSGKKPPSRKGIEVTLETRQKMANSHRGEKAHNYRGGYENKLMHNRNRRAMLKGAEGTFTHVEWIELKARYGCKCAKCKTPETIFKLTVDHIIPLSKGGRNSIDNIQPLCGSCNSKKYNF